MTGFLTAAQPPEEEAGGAPAEEEGGGAGLRHLPRRLVTRRWARAALPRRGPAATAWRPRSEAFSAEGARGIKAVEARGGEFKTREKCICKFGYFFIALSAGGTPDI